MTSRHIKILLSIGIAVVAGCDPQADHRTLTEVPFVVSPRPTALYVKDSLRAPGPFNQLCVGFPDTYQIFPGSSPNNAGVRRPDGMVIQLSAALIGPQSPPEVFPFARVDQGHKSRSACFEARPARDTRRRYSRVELTASDSVMVFDVRWDAGKRFGSP